MKRYVIQKGNEFVSYAFILSVEGVVSINRASYTDDLMSSQVFDETEKAEDVKAWEEFFGLEHNNGFSYKEIEFILR